MDGFSKIELSSPTPEINSQNKIEPEVKTGSRFGKFKRLRNRKVYLGLGIFFAIFLLLIVIPGILTLISAKRTYAQVNATMAALKSQNIELTEKELDKTRESLEDTKSKLNLLFVLRIIPGPNIYYNDARHMVNAGIYGLDAADVFVDSVKPYADVLGLKGEGSFTGGSAEQRIQTMVSTMGKVTPKIDDIAESLEKAQKEIDEVNPNHYPKFIAGGKVHEGMVTLRTVSDDGVAFINEAKPLIKAFPELLGEKEEKKYLLIFQNDKELRPTGGFITAYAIFKIDKGVIKVEKSEDIYTLDATISNKPKAPEPILKYLANVPKLNLRDTNLSPDFPTSMDSFNELYETAGGYEDVDGIITLDTQALVAAMNILGDIEVNGQTFTSKRIDERCNCPQVIYELTEFAGIRVQYIRPDRKTLIGDLMFAIMNKAFTSSPKEYWGPLVQAMFTQVAQKHIMFDLENKGAQEGLSAVNAAGEIRDFEGDYFHLNEANFGGSKSNLFVDQGVEQNYDIKDGVITKTVTVNYKNPFKPSNCNLEAENSLCLNAPWRNWFRVYVPKGSKLKTSSGSEVKVTTYEEFDKTVFDGFLTVRPLGVGKLTLVYTLPFKLKEGSPLPVMIQKQPGTDNDEYVFKVNSKTKDKFILDTDKTIKLDI